MQRSYSNSPSTTTAPTLAIESGRIVVVPIARHVARAMDEYCLFLPFGGGRMPVSVKIAKHPTHPKKHTVDRIVLGTCDELPVVGHVWGTFPLLFIGDATFFYAVDSEERERAFSSAKKESKHGGSYRCNDGQVGVCVRLGEKDIRIVPEISYDPSGDVNRVDITVPWVEAASRQG